MAAAGRIVIQAVRPHAPLIKFPNRLGIPKPDVQEVLKTAVVGGFQQSSGAHSSPGPAASLFRIPGPPDSAASIRILPQRYHRRMLAMDEMDYIQRGGPE